MERYDVAIIGAGPGGYVAAIYAARLGKKAAVIEKDQVGGVCLNKGCIPTKALLSSVEVLNRIKEGSAFGIDVASYKIDFKKINKRKDEVVERLRQGILSLFKARKISLINGSARLEGAHKIDISGSLVEADNIIIATGSSPLEIPTLKFNHKNIISSDDILDLSEIPQRLVVIGSGAIGCEFSAIFNALGSEVTIVEMMSEILPNIDAEVSKKLSSILKKRGIDILTASKVERLIEKDGNVRAYLSSGQEIFADKVLVCVGRTPNTDSLNLEAVGVAVSNGKIVTDEHTKTNIANIYAIGDVSNRYQLAHVASYEGMIACENIFKIKKKADYRSVPNCIYTDPEVASVGLSEEAAKAAGHDIKIARFPFLSLGKAHCEGKTDGFIKLIGEKATGKILGVHILGAGAANLIAEAALAIRYGMAVEELGETIHAHPTLAEGLMEASHIFQEKGIHVL